MGVKDLDPILLWMFDCEERKKMTDKTELFTTSGIRINIYIIKPLTACSFCFDADKHAPFF